MIRREFDDGWYLFTQYDHSILSGEIMKQWGNEEFQTIDREIIYAVTNHDRGWKDWDSSPRINPENKFPASFIDMYPEEQHTIWSKCFEEIPSEHSYSSALIALHFSTFNNSLLSGSPDNQAMIDFKNKIYSLVSGTLNIDFDTIENNLPDEVHRGLKYIQIGDIISLAFCNGWESISIKDAPSGSSVQEKNLTLESGDGINYNIYPYPFAENEIEFSTEAVTVKGKKFESDQDLHTAIKNGEKKEFTFTIRKDA